MSRRKYKNECITRLPNEFRLGRLFLLNAEIEKIAEGTARCGSCSRNSTPNKTERMRWVEAVRLFTGH